MASKPLLPIMLPANPNLIKLQLSTAKASPIIYHNTQIFKYIQYLRIDKVIKYS